MGAQTTDRSNLEGAFGVRISRDSLSSQAYLAIRNSLKRSKFLPGHKLIARQIADELGISVTPVRESLLRLVSENALAMDERGTVIVPRMSIGRCKDIRDMRMLVEGEAAARAACRATEADIAELNRIHTEYLASEKAQNYSEALARNEEFHFGLCHLAGSSTLFAVVENLWIQFGPVLPYLYLDGERPFHGETHAHLVVMGALARGDADGARAAIARDILIGGGTIIDRLGGSSDSHD